MRSGFLVFAGRMIAMSLLAVLTFPTLLARAAESTVHLDQDATGRFRPVILESGDMRVLADVNSITAPAVSPDGSRVAFSGAVGDESLGRFALFVVGTNGKGLRQLTGGSAGEFDPAWSPNGRYLVFAQNQGGSLTETSCCRLARVDVQSLSVVGLTGPIGAQRPEYSPDGKMIVFDNPSGVWTMPSSGGTPTRRAAGGFDASFSPDGQSVVYVRRGGSYQIRIQHLGGSDSVVYSTGRAIESPTWNGERIWFMEHLQVGYDSRVSLNLRSIHQSGSDLSVEHSFSSPAVGVDLISDNDEMFFYRRSGSFRYYDVTPQAGLLPILTGNGYSQNWDSITAVDLDGDLDDEMLFYRRSGAFRYYHVTPQAGLIPILTGTGYTQDWDAITAVDLDGDGQDEMFFYRADGMFGYYDIAPDATLGAPILAGTGYTQDWDAMTAVDLDGDGQDEMFFYRSDGLFGYFDIGPDATLGPPVLAGNGYSPNWDSITAIDLDGDGADEMFFYRESGSFRYYDVTPAAGLVPILSGTGYSQNWDSITAVDLD